MISRLVRPLWACAVAIMAVAAFSRPVPLTSSTLQQNGLTTEALQNLHRLGVPTTATLDRRYRMITHTMPTPLPAGAADKLSTDSALQYIYTSRPILLVGWFKSYDSATSTVLVRVDPILTKFPHTVDVRSKQLNVPDERIKNRELRPERTFKIDESTYVIDDTASLDPKPGERRQRPVMPLEALKAGDKITLSYRIQATADVVPRAMNISKVDPRRTYFSADFDPSRGRMIPRRQIKVTSGSAEQKEFLRKHRSLNRGAGQ